MRKIIKKETIDKLIQGINAGSNIYDIMAAVCLALSPYSSQNIRDYDCNNIKYQPLKDCIQAYENGMNNTPDEKNGLFDELQKAINKWLENQRDNMKEIEYIDIYSVINNIDSIYTFKWHRESDPSKQPFEPDRLPLSLKSSAKESEEPFIRLNKTHSESYNILPKYKNLLAGKMNKACKKKTNKDFRDFRTDHEGNTLSAKLNNYVIINVAPESYFPIIHCVSGNNALIISDRLRAKKDCLKVGMFPLWAGNANNTLNFKYTANTFYIDGIPKEFEESLLERLKKALDRCKEKKVDIAIFPEMIMTRKNLDAIINRIKKEHADDLPILMVMGTIWETVNENGELIRINESVVLSCFGEVVATQRKKLPAFWKKPDHIYAKGEKGHEEELAMDRSIHMIDIEGVGRFSILICKDVLDDNIMPLLKSLYTDMVFVPAFSTSSKFTGELDPLTTVFWVSVLFCNACSALYSKESERIKAEWIGAEWIPNELIGDNIKGDDREEVKTDYLEIGFVRTPSKEGSEQNIHHKPLHFLPSCISCESRECPGRFFNIYYTEYDGDCNKGNIRVEDDNV